MTAPPADARQIHLTNLRLPVGILLPVPLLFIALLGGVLLLLGGAAVRRPYGGASSLGA